MKKFLSIILALTLFFSFTACRKNDSDATFENCNKIYNVEDYGIVGDSLDNAKENVKALNKLIKRCKKGSCIKFSDKTYYFDSTEGCIKVNNKNSLLIYGENTTIINTSFDPTKDVSSEKYHASMVMEIADSENVRIEGISFDYYRYTQVFGKIAERYAGLTSIELDPAFLSDGDKPKITGDELVSAVAVLDGNGAAKEDYYADGFFKSYLQGNKFYIFGDYGKVGMDAIARFTLSTAPVFYAKNTKNLTFENVKSFSSPAALFMMTGTGSEDFTFNNVTVAPPENAPWKWGCNVDGIYVSGLSGKLHVSNCTFKGMGDDALNVHSAAAKVKAVSGNKVILNHAEDNTTINSLWAKKGDTLIFYKDDFSVCAKAKVKKRSLTSLTLEITEGEISVGDIVENASLSPEVNIENVKVDGGRARAFLIQSDNVEIRNCEISNLGFAGIIISPDINKWYEMGPSENILISGCTFTNVCAMNSDSCKGAVFSASSHDGKETKELIHKNITVEKNIFKEISVPCVNLSSVKGATLKSNIYPENCEPKFSNCENVIIE